MFGGAPRRMLNSVVNVCLNPLTTETQRTQRLHREDHAKVGEGVMRIVFCLTLACLIALLVVPAAFAQDSNSTDPLVRILVTKGVLTPEEGRAIVSKASPAEQ